MSWKAAWRKLSEPRSSLIKKSEGCGHTKAWEQETRALGDPTLCSAVVPMCMGGGILSKIDN